LFNEYTSLFCELLKLSSSFGIDISSIAQMPLKTSISSSFKRSFAIAPAATLALVSLALLLPPPL